MTSPQRKSSSRKKRVPSSERTTATATSLPSMQLSKRSKVIMKKRVIRKEDRDATRKKVRRLQNQFAGRVVTRNLSDNTVTRYRAASGASAKRKASEEMGESGAVAWLNHRTGQNLTISRPKAAAPFARTFTNGVAWPDAVAFNGAGVADVVHWDGTAVHVVEAKGGGSALKTGPFGRTQKYDPETGEIRPLQIRQSASPPKVDQGTVEYLTDIAYNMYHSTNQDRRASVGKAILDAVEGGNLEYFAVSTKIEEGKIDATVTVMNLDEE
jgi:hypothetical protein